MKKIELKIEIPAYLPEEGLKYNWEENFAIDTKIENGSIIIKANREGLVSLANHLLNLSQQNVPSYPLKPFDDFHDAF